METIQINKNIEKNDNCKETMDIKLIWEKINDIKTKLRLKEVSDKNSSCFWCTCPFDNPAVYIPKNYNEGKYDVYGCFCSPECAVAHLKNENIDETVKWERYAFLNNVYRQVYNYEKNIKPAPNPHYTLDKFYGTLTIKEYRRILNNDKLLMVMDKPMTKILPGLYEENNDLPNVYNNLVNDDNEENVQLRLKKKEGIHSKQSSLKKNFKF